MLYDLLLDLPANEAIGNNFVKGYSIIKAHKNIMCCVSGGSDSDIMVDLVVRMSKDFPEVQITYIWFDTGLEYEATKQHLSYLESRYGIVIERIKVTKPVALSVRDSNPFINKQASEYIHRLQLHGFEFKDKTFEELYKEYPDCKMALMWWCNNNPDPRCNIRNNKWLKEFLVANPPKFPVGHSCCENAKRKPSAELIKERGFDLVLTAVRKAEGGVRAVGMKGCYTQGVGLADAYRPVWWYTDEDKRVYEEYFGIVHSECYTKYGLKRTGCIGCPFGRNCNAELEAAKKFEPRLYRAVTNIFANSYSYTADYRKFVEKMNELCD